IGYNAQASNHDAMLWVEWTLGSAPGTHTAGMEVFATPQGATLTGSFRDTEIETGEGTVLDLSIVNTDLVPASDLGFTFALPDGLAVGDGEVDTTCGGTFDA